MRFGCGLCSVSNYLYNQRQMLGPPVCVCASGRAPPRYPGKDHRSGRASHTQLVRIHGPLSLLTFPKFQSSSSENLPSIVSLTPAGRETPSTTCYRQLNGAEMSRMWTLDTEETEGEQIGTRSHGRKTQSTASGLTCVLLMMMMWVCVCVCVCVCVWLN